MEWLSLSLSLSLSCRGIRWIIIESEPGSIELTASLHGTGKDSHLMFPTRLMRLIERKIDLLQIYGGYLMENKLHRIYMPKRTCHNRRSDDKFCKEKITSRFPFPSLSRLDWMLHSSSSNLPAISLRKGPNRAISFRLCHLAVSVAFFLFIRWLCQNNTISCSLLPVSLFDVVFNDGCPVRASYVDRFSLRLSFIQVLCLLFLRN